jgi:hypothetical protein
MSEMNPEESTDPIWETRMRTLMRRKRIMEVEQIINDALWEWYSDRGLEVPNWRMQKDPQWWVDYLAELNGEDECS